MECYWTRQNDANAEHIAAFMGVGQVRFTNEFKEHLGKHGQGVLKARASYLRACSHFHGSPPMVFYRKGRVWKLAVIRK